MANQRPGALPQKTREMLEAAILRAAITGQTGRSLAAEFGVHYQTVCGIRRALKKSGVLDAKAGKSAQPKTVEGLMPWRVSDMAQFLRDLPNMRGLTDQEKINLLSHMALHQTGAPAVAAVKALDDLENSIAARTRTSLELPKTRDEKLERLRRMCEVVGEDLWLAALSAERARSAALEEERRLRTGSHGEAGATQSGDDAPPLEIIEIDVPGSPASEPVPPDPASSPDPANPGVAAPS